MSRTWNVSARVAAALAALVAVWTPPSAAVVDPPQWADVAGLVHAAPTAARAASGPKPVRAPRDHRPNVVLISADDMRRDELRYLPKTRALLGREGMRFTDALTPHPLCCPARAELFTGQLAQNNGVRTNFPPQGGYAAFDPEHTIGRWLHAAGYNTAFVGKHLNALPKNVPRDPGWTIFDPSLRGYNDYVDFVQYNDGDPERVAGRDHYYTDYIAHLSTTYLHRLSGYDAPFFLWVSHFGPHTVDKKRCAGSYCHKAPPPSSPSYDSNPRQVERDRELSRHRAARLFRSPAFNEPDRSDKQHLLATAQPIDPSYVERLVRGRIAALRAVDRAVADVVEQLADDGELDDTYLMFITDNGYLLGEHSYVGKILGYEPSVRTPLLVRGPGIRAGSVSDRTVTLVDLAPTWLDIAGATADVTQDGVSLLPILHGDGQAVPHPGGVLVQAGPHRLETGARGWYFRGVRTRRYTYLRYQDGWVELYDRRRDPKELSSVAHDPRYARIAMMLAHRTRVLAGCTGAGCNRAFHPLPPPRAS
ncbi:MAG TPA: sulfatase [Nocardioides sp.]|uniref:sulfatase family protein n=1 Tax=Nocardioides sp. TaxID=35761 RepID=UPI002E34AB3E|nr:sulfatase [Nocardioides sp.]HEX5090193.1 sulfatase [Nocardioides sp.]